MCYKSSTVVMNRCKSLRDGSVGRDC